MSDQAKEKPKETVCPRCQHVFRAEEQKRDRCPGCREPHPGGTYSKMCGWQYCRCAS